MFSITCFICAGKSPTASLPFLSKAGVPDTKSSLPTLTAGETGTPRTDFPKYSRGVFADVDCCCAAARSPQTKAAQIMAMAKGRAFMGPPICRYRMHVHGTAQLEFDHGIRWSGQHGNPHGAMQFMQASKSAAVS